MKFRQDCQLFWSQLVIVAARSVAEAADLLFN
jgi:hypothetical protein